MLRAALLLLPLPALLVACGGSAAPVPERADRPDDAVRSAFAVVAGGRMHELEAGPPDGPEVLLLHGQSFRASTWEELGTLARLGARGYRAIALDLPGYGESERAPGAVPEEWLLAALDSLGLARPVVVSPSMSGAFALPVAARHPERLRGLVAVAPVRIPEHLADLAAGAPPVLCLWGSEDRTVPLEQAERLVAVVPGAGLVVLEGAGHASYLDDPEGFHAALFAFLEGLPAGH